MFYLFYVGMSHRNYFPVTRLIDYDCYYPYGNTPPEDLLQSITGDVSEPEVLLLGCGDLRSCLYTLWNNFDPRHSRQFKGVHFILNDVSIGVLARNIIFLYLCTKLPSNKDDIIEWITSFWSIWFCHELLPQHKQVLMDSLSQLLEWSKSPESWSEKTNNPLRKLVRFITPSTLADIHEIWQIWYHDDRSAEVIRSGRMELLKKTGSEEYHHQTEIHLVRCFGTFKFHMLSPSEIKCMKGEIEQHHERGTAFAEDVFNLPAGQSSIANSTYFENLDGMYTAHNGYPYRCFSHAYQFFPEYVKKLGYSILVNNKSFKDHPLLANSVQQFSVWVSSCAAIFSKPSHVSFSFQHSDALGFCQNLCHKVFASSIPVPHSFDAIYTSNLIDYIALPSLVLVAMSILKQTGLLFTTAFRYIMISGSSTKYLHSVFGFDSKYLPVLCGIRCIGYDDQYSAKWSVKPVSIAAEADVLQYVIEKSLVWQHIVATPLKQIVPKDFSTLLSALCDAVKQMLTRFMNGPSTTIVESLLCTETVVLLLQSFASQLDNEYDCTSYKFWSPLCSLLLNQRYLQPFIMSLQTQSLLHGLHLHLTESELSCPLCNKIPISDFICQYSTEVLNHDLTNEPRIAILIHNLGPVDAKVLKVWANIQTSCIDNVHVISSIAKRSTDGKIWYEFFIPMSLTKKAHYITIVFFDLESGIRIAHGKLSAYKITEISYQFTKQIKRRFTPGYQGFGTILQHSGNSSCFESIIGLSDQSMHSLEHHHMATSLSALSRVRFIIGALFIEIHYPYPINYSKMSIKLSKKNKRITVSAYRKCHHLYEEEQPVYIVNPDNALVLPAMPTSEIHHLTKYSNFQYSLKESAVLQETIPQSPELNAKVTVGAILQQYTKDIFQIVYYGEPANIDQIYTKCQCFVVIDALKFDVLNKTPAVDMWFCFLTPEKCKKIYQQWYAVYETESGSTKQGVNYVDKKECQLLQDIFNYFASRTVSTSKEPGSKRYQLLVKHKIACYFTRAVVYPLYPSYSMMGLGKMGLPKSFDHITDTAWYYLCAAKEKGLPVSLDQLADSVIHHLNATGKPVKNKCSLCGNYSESLMRCSRCRSTQYCNRECQKKHWSTHKAVCHLQGCK